MYTKHPEPQPFPGLNLKVGKMIYRLGTQSVCFDVSEHWYSCLFCIPLPFLIPLFATRSDVTGREAGFGHGGHLKGTYFGSLLFLR